MEVKGVPEGKQEIIVAENNFHGRTTTIVGFSSDYNSRYGFGPFPPGFVKVPYDDVEALSKAVNENTVGVLLEPIQGEAGIIIPPDGYLRDVRRICTEHNVAMITDEIQTGLGRTGKLLAEEHEGVEADMTLIGKALSGGFYPVSAVLSNKEVLGVFQPGDHGATFGGNPLACAVARMAVKVLIEEGMIENAAKMGEYVMGRLQRIESPFIKEVRGRGLMIGIELVRDRVTREPAREESYRFEREALKRGVLFGTAKYSGMGNVVKIKPPAVITDAQAEKVMEVFEEVLRIVSPR